MEEQLERQSATRPEEIIKSFTKEDYQTSVAPYEWLYKFKDNPFQMERLRGLILEDAKLKKVPNVGKLWQEYLNLQVSGKGRSIAQNVTAFSSQPLELNCGDYDCYDDGVVCANNFDGLTTVCPHPIMVSKRLVNIETGEVKLEVAYRRGKGWRRNVFDKATLSTARNITALASCGISVTSETAKDLVRYLAFIEDANYDELPEIKTVGRLGWVDGYGFSPYVEDLMYDSAGMYGDAFNAVKAHGSFEKWMEVAKSVRKGASIPCRIILAASFASPLLAKVGALPFILHLWGSVSGTGKSVALILAASVWAYPEIGSYVKTTKSTNVGYEQMAAFCGHLPLCMDELQMIQGKKEFDELIYSLCEGVSKTRGSKTGGMQQVQRWRNAILTTGEQPITTANSKAGAVNRVIEVECTEKLFEDPRWAYQLLVENYGHAGREFVQQLSQREDMMRLMKDLQQSFYECMQGKATDKQILTASIILAADAMADVILFKDDRSLEVEDIMPYLATKNDANTNRRAYEWLVDLVASNPARFYPGENSSYSGECWGCVENGEKVYIVKSVFDRLMTDVGFSPASFLSWANQSGLIERTGKHLTKMKRIEKGKTPARCVCLRIPDDEVENTFEAMQEQQHV